MCFASGLFFPTGRILSNDFHGERTRSTPRAVARRCPRCRRGVSLLFFLSFLRLSFGIPFFFSTRESSLRLPSSLSRRINRSNSTNYRILLSGPLPTDEVSSSPFFSFPSTSSSFHPRNQKRSPAEQFYPFVGKRPGPARKPGDNPLPLLPTIPRPVRLRELLPPRSSRLNDAASRPFRHSRRGLTSTINGQTIA